MHWTTRVAAASVAAGLLMLGSTASAVDVTPQQLQAAKTPADHEAIAQAYDEEARALDKRAAGHRSMAQAYASPNPKGSWSPNMVKHCESLATQAEAAARDYRALADEHRKLVHGAHR